jgi:hypothetical protein
MGEAPVDGTLLSRSTNSNASDILQEYLWDRLVAYGNMKHNGAVHRRRGNRLAGIVRRGLDQSGGECEID